MVLLSSSYVVFWPFMELLMCEIGVCGATTTASGAAFALLTPFLGNHLRTFGFGFAFRSFGFLSRRKKTFFDAQDF